MKTAILTNSLNTRMIEKFHLNAKSRIHVHVCSQFMRYVLVGLVSNLLLYLVYIVLTTLGGVGPKTAMSALYAAGVAQTFLFNRHWTFRHQGDLNGTFVRYVATYAFGYLLNLYVLWVAVDCFHLSHQIIQGVMILVLAVLLFLVQKFWVFRK
jgi:putative flippase GtrA